MTKQTENRIVLDHEDFAALARGEPVTKCPAGRDPVTIALEDIGFRAMRDAIQPPQLDTQAIRHLLSGARDLLRADGARNIPLNQATALGAIVIALAELEAHANQAD